MGTSAGGRLFLKLDLSVYYVMETAEGGVTCCDIMGDIGFDLVSLVLPNYKCGVRNVTPAACL